MNQVPGPQQHSEINLRLNAIIETATDGIITIDINGTMELVNSAAARLFDYPIHELQGRNINMLMPSPHREEHDGYIKRYMEDRQPRIIGIGREVTGRRKDGTTFPIRLSVSEVKLEDRVIFTGIVHDLTDQKRTEKALREEKERAEKYFNIANTLMLVLDDQERIQLINDKGCELLGKNREDLIGANWFDTALSGIHRKAGREAFHQLIQGHSIDYYESPINTASGNEKLIAWRNRLLQDDDGRTIGIIGSGIDITAQRDAEKRIVKMNAGLEKKVEERTDELAKAVNQLLQTNQQLKHEIKERKGAEASLRKNESQLLAALEKEKELNQLKSRFVSMASHEFRTPLSTILSSADLIEAYAKEEHQEKRVRHTTRIKSSVANLIGILNDFLSLSKLEEGKLQPQLAEFSPAELCNEIMEEIQGLLKNGQHIHLQRPSETVRLHMDRRIMKNICLNLLSNAIKYSEANQLILWEFNVDAKQIEIVIADKGIGIPETEQQHLFTRFFRAHNVENIQGTGLGLNIVKRYVDMLNGTIRFESRLGEGSTFWVNLPIYREEQ
ncbi:MAG TPA: PAS domain S-box protein [Saprospiraceae bacterium]|nr:PAS domain S-box protein [Saprospiraceae bacterium]HMQ83639.1 PAS domain S-box protein [Saprospiraceae bacterium]